MCVLVQKMLNNFLAEGGFTVKNFNLTHRNLHLIGEIKINLFYFVDL